jgi:hypothetical protein
LSVAFQIQHGLNFLRAAANVSRLPFCAVSRAQQEAAKKNCADFGPDPEWNNIQKTSEADGKIEEKVESTFMDPWIFRR